MNNFVRYLDLVVDPTFEDMKSNPNSIRHAYISCVVTYHSIDRVAAKPGNLRKQWRDESLEFMLVDIVAHHFKHVKSNDERIAIPAAGIPLAHALGFGHD